VTSSRTALVTGANQGLGLALVEGLADRMASGDRVLLTGRDAGRVADAVLRAGTRTARVEGRVLDVRDLAAIAALAAELGAVDIVISNATARTTPDQDPVDVVDAILETSNLATSHVLRRLGPIVRPGGRLLVVASSLGRLGHLPPATQARFTETATLDEVDAIMRDWASSVRAGTAQADGWPEWLNIPSKVGQVAAVRAVARERRVRDLADGILVASICPGLFDTPTSRPWFDDFSDAQTPAEAAVALLDLALGPDVDPALYGELVRFGRVLPWREPIAAAG
jgi:carbonyl reductase 1